jgi:hypothetical protein
MRKDRGELLRRLESVTAGLASREAVEQSSCFVFVGGRVHTFNDEVSCSAPCDIGFDGAIAAKPLLDLLGKMTEQEIDVSLNEEGSELVVKGKRRRAGITLDNKITLPISSVEQPEEWSPIGPEFGEGVAVAKQCAGNDPNSFHLTCIHVTPEFVEACDNFHLARYPVETGVSENCLVKADSLRDITGLGMTDISETTSWLHFKNASELVYSVRRELMDYEELDDILDVDGEPTTLPGGLAEAVDKASVFSGDNAESNAESSAIFVTLKPKQLSIKGVGSSGWYEERKTVKWEGEPMSFSIPPKLLIDVSEKSQDCFIAPGRLKVDGGSFTYVTCLGAVE